MCRKSVAVVRHQIGERKAANLRACARSLISSFVPFMDKQQTHCSQATTGLRHGLSVAPCVCPAAKGRAEASLTGRGSSPAEKTLRESGYGCSTGFAIRKATQKRSPATRIRLKSTPRTCGLYRSASSLWLIIAAPQLRCKPNHPGASQSLSMQSLGPQGFPPADGRRTPPVRTALNALHPCTAAATGRDLLHIIAPPRERRISAKSGEPASREGRAKEFSCRACGLLPACTGRKETRVGR